MSNGPKFTNSNGVRLLSSLFVETCRTPEATPVYTLSDNDKPGYPSLYKLYMEVADPTEYVFATTHLHDWKHWIALSTADWFQPYVERWRSELELKIKSMALRRMIDDSASGGRDGQSAAKFILEKGWAPKNEKGRPSKQDIREAADRIASDGSQVDNDLERLGLIHVHSRNTASNS